MVIPTPDDRAATIIIIDRDENRVATLGSKNAPVFDPIYRDAENEAISLTFRTISNCEEAAHLKQRNMVIVEDPWDANVFRLLEIVEVDQITDERGPQLEITCDDQALIELSGNYVDDIRLYDTDPLDALTRLLSAGDSRWQVGDVSLTGIGSTNIYHESVSEGLKKLSETWGGIFRFRVTMSGNRITGRYIDWHDPSQWEDYTGVRWETGKNIRHLRKTVISSNVATAIYPYGRGQTLEEDEQGRDPVYGRRIDISEVEWSKAKGDPVDKPLGQKWIGDPEALQRWGYRDPETGDLRHIFHVEVFEDEEDPENLALLGWKKLQEISQEWATYEAEIVDRSRDPRYAHETTRIGTAGILIDDNFNPPIEVRARVIGAEVNLNNKRDLRLTLGSFTPNLFDDVRNIQREVERKVDIGSPITLLDTTVRNLRDRMRNTVGYKYESETLGTLWANGPYGDPETDSYLQIKGGIMAIADRWDPVANEPAWRTFGTGSGFVADLITTGTLDASRVHIYSYNENWTSEITLYSGFFSSYINGELTARIGGYGADFFARNQLSGGIYASANSESPTIGIVSTARDYWAVAQHSAEDPNIIEPKLYIDFPGNYLWVDAQLFSVGPNAYIDTRDGYTYWGQSEGNYMRQRSSDGRIEFVMDGVIRHQFNADGSKVGGTIEIDGETWGMSPIDSPKVLIEDVIFDQVVNEDGVMIELDERLSKALSNYAVFPSRGDVAIVNKTPNSFIVRGPAGKVDLRIIGIRKGKENIYWADMRKIEMRIQGAKKLAYQRPKVQRAYKRED